MDKIRILLIEDDVYVCNNFESFAKKYDDIEIVKITNSSTEAIKYINELTPDAIILDLELHDGEGSGLDVLEAVKSGEIKHKPFILVTTNNPSDITLRLTQQNGADFTCKKYQFGYSEEVALNNVLMFKAQLLAKRKYLDDTLLEFDDEYQTQVINSYTQLIFEQLNQYGISAKSLAFDYYMDAILYVIEDRNVNYIKKISQKYNKTSDSIRKVMLRAIEKAWNHPSKFNLNDYTGHIDLQGGEPSIDAFVHYYAKKIQIKK